MNNKQTKGEKKMTKGQILEAYFAKKSELDALTKEVEALRAQVIEIGDCTANGFRSFVSDQERRSVSLVEIEKTSQKLYAELLAEKLVKTNVAKIVKVKKLEVAA